MGASIRESQIRLLTPDQKEMADCIGFEAYSKLAAYYGGSRVYVAKLASLELAERDSRIIRDYKAGKTSTAELAVRRKPQAYPGNHQKAAVKQGCGGTTQWEKHRRNY